MSIHLYLLLIKSNDQNRKFEKKICRDISQQDFRIQA